MGHSLRLCSSAFLSEISLMLNVSLCKILCAVCLTLMLHSEEQTLSSLPFSPSNPQFQNQMFHKQTKKGREL